MIHGETLRPTAGESDNKLLPKILVGFGPGRRFHMPKPTLKIVSPNTKIRKVTPRRRPKNTDVRTREYLTEREVEQLIEGCKGNRRPHRDQTMILLAFRHGLRASELCDLQWTQVDLEHARLAVTRAKHGTPSTHPLTGRELRALRRLHRETENKSPFLFLSERGSPMTVSNFQKLINGRTELDCDDRFPSRWSSLSTIARRNRPDSTTVTLPC